MKKRCEQCGSVFDADQATRRFCSNECKFASRRNQVEKKCAVCGQWFSVQPHRADAKFCSRKCRVSGLTIAITTETKRAALTARIPVGNARECWPWQGSTLANGYGLVRIGRRFQVYAHRLSYETFVGPIPEGALVCHSCDNPPCCNPRHLFLGSDADNLRDMVSKDRQSRGERRYNRKLTDKAVRAIRASLLGPTRLAEIYGVDQSIISGIIARKRWRHVK